MVEPKVLAGLALVVGQTEMVLGEDVIPALKQFFVAQYGLSPEEAARLDRGYDDLLALQRKSRARRADVAATA